MKRKRKPGPIKGEKAWWRKEEQVLKRVSPEIYRQSRAREGIARILGKPLRRWQNSRKQLAVKWAEIEKYLFSGKANPKNLLQMLASAQESVAKTIGLEEYFLKTRAVATKFVLKEIDLNALQRIWAMKDTKAELNSERMFYGHLKELGDAGKIAKFAELITRLKMANDKEYTRLRKRLALAGIGIQDQSARTDAAIKNASERYLSNKISGEQYVKDTALAEYALTHQYFEFAKAGEELYARLARNARDRDLKKILKHIGREMKRRKLIHMSEKFGIEMQFRQNEF